MRRKVTRRLEVIHRDCAGIDIGGSRHFVAVDPSRSEEPVQSFGSFTDELERMGRWLHECGVVVVAMESTGVYWIPVYEVLERMGLKCTWSIRGRPSRSANARATCWTASGCGS
jgi:transposase